jgi:hypothetical protein
MQPDLDSPPEPPQPERQDLRDLLKETEAADFLDAAVERRFGEVIGRVLFNPKKQWW